jgi:putative ABC transport system permease protein
VLSRHNASRPFSERLFSVLLRLFPRDFRRHFANEMETVFRDQYRDAQATGGPTHVRFWWDTARGLIVTAFQEHREILFQDVDYALRMMQKELGFTAVVITIIGLAIGASTAAFTAANAILIQPLPFSGGDYLIHLHQRQPAAGVEDLLFSVKEIEDYRAQNHTLDSVVEFHSMSFSLLGGREPERVDTGVVSANFFRVLGVTPLYGRTFIDDDDKASAHPVLILSYNFWRRSFASDPSVVGQTYSMNDKQHVVVGVLPPIPQFPEEVDVYMPTSACPMRSGERVMHDRSHHMMNVFATLRPGVTLAQAQNDLREIADKLRTSYPEAYPAAKGYDIALQPVHQELTSGIRPVLAVLAAAAALLLLLACSNVAGLMLSRMLSRTRELTIRTVLGASRSRIIRSFVTEGILLAAGGGVLGLLLAFWSLDVVVRFASKYTSLSSQLHISAQEVAFCVGLSIVCGVVIGLVPTLSVRQTAIFGLELVNAYNPGRVGLRARGTLVAAQLALSVILLVGAGLTLRSLVKLEHINGGFEASGVFSARIYALNNNYKTFFNDLLDRTRRLPGVQAAALSSTFPLYTRAGTDNDHSVEIRGGVVSDRTPIRVRIVTPDYFHTLGIRTISGRGFTEEDDGKTTPAFVIINEHMANHYWPNQSAVGKQFSVSPEKEWLTVVGVVGDVRQDGLDKEPVSEVYGTFAESPIDVASLLIRSSQSPKELGEEIKWTAHDLDRDAVVADLQPVMEVRQNSLAPRRTTTVFLSIFAIIALCITASGISGMMAISVGERKHEISVRLALGATPRRVIGSMMGQALALILAGLGAGFVITWLMSTSMSGVIFGVGPRDSVTFVLSSALLVAVATLASFVPLTRVAKLDPVVLLRAE